MFLLGLAINSAAQVAMLPIEGTHTSIPFRTYFCGLGAPERKRFYVVQFKYRDNENYFRVRLSYAPGTEPTEDADAFSAPIELLGSLSRDVGLTFILRPKGRDAEMRVDIDATGGSTGRLKMKDGTIDLPCVLAPPYREAAK
ncbi:hypothetical protein [Sphingomonas canadensis]